MIRKSLFVILALFVMASFSYASEREIPKTQKEKVSYAIGMELAGNLKKTDIDLDFSYVIEGLKDAYAGKKPRVDEKDLTETMAKFQKEYSAKQADERKKMSEKNKKEGETFLAENKKKPGVVTLASGLQYKVIEEGKGKSPKASDNVTVHYKGTLIDGTEFDSSFRRGQPATFNVSAVIPGWTEALQKMKEGSKWQLFIPSKLAYGEQGAGRAIGPNSTLIFEVELISVK